MQQAAMPKSQSGTSHGMKWVLANRNMVLSRLENNKRRSQLIRTVHISRVNPKRKAQLRWLEQWDIDSVLSENVDIANSQAAVAIPLVDTAITPSLHISLSISYTSGDVSTNGLFGNGWSVHNIGEDFITAEHQQSAFAHNTKYKLSIDGNAFNLIPSKDKVDVFSLAEDANVTVTFQRDSRRWIVETPNLKTTYGTPEASSGMSSAIQTSLRWPYWRGPGTDEGTLVPEDITWYVVSRQEKFGNNEKLFYTYKIETKTTTSAKKPYTSVIQLESIYDNEQKNKLELIYDEKDESEYIEKQYKNAEGTIQFPVYLTKKHYLIGYNLETPGYQQHVQFEYICGTLGTRSLTEVVQIFNENGGSSGEREKIFVFDYVEKEPGKNMLMFLQIPSYNSSVSYDYEKLSLPLMKFGTDDLDTFTFPTVENIQLKQADDYGVMAYDIGTGGIYVQVVNRQLTKRTMLLYTGENQNKVITLGEDDPKKIKNFAIMVFTDLISVLEETGEEKRLHFFYRSGETWPVSPTTTFHFPKQAVVRPTGKNILVNEDDETTIGKLFLYQPIANDDEKQRNNDGFKQFTLDTGCATCRIDRLATQDDVIVAYNGNTLFGWKENKAKESWERTNILDIQSKEITFFNDFDVNKDFAKSMIDRINATGLHINDNMVYLPVIEWTKKNDSILKVTANLMLLDDNMGIRLRETHPIYEQRVNTAELMRDDLMEDTQMFFNYTMMADNKFHVLLQNITGKAYEEACEEQDDKEKCRQDIINHQNDDTGFQNDMRDLFLFDSASMTTFQLDSKGASTRNHTFVLQGNSWVKKDNTEGSIIKLGNNFRMDTVPNADKGETKYTLYRQNPANGGSDGSALREWTMDDQNSTMAFGYPSYVCMQPEPKGPLKLVPFRDRREPIDDVSVGNPGETVLQMSNQEVFVTIKNYANPEQPIYDRLLTVRRINSIIPSVPVWVLSRSNVTHGKQSRSKTYANEYRFDIPSKSQTNTIRITPNGDKSISGYYEEITTVPVADPADGTKTQNWYDVDGNVVESKDVQTSIDMQTKNAQEADEETKKWRKIWDNSGQLEISNISPYNITDNAVGYHGFENYEKNSTFLSYPPECLLRNDIAFTGSNLVRLQGTEKVSGSFTPKNQLGTYVLSSWVRLPLDSEDAFEFDIPSQNLQANLLTDSGYRVFGMYAQMKRKLRDWIYLEVIVDLFNVRNNIYSEIYRMSESSDSMSPPSSTNFTISLELTAGTSSWVDIDHIRFSPLNFDFSVNIYNSISGLETDRILPDGSVIRKIYNQYGTEIATVDEENQVDQVKCLSRSGFVFPSPVADSNIAVQSIRREVVLATERGCHELFDKYSLEHIWSIENMDDPSIWLISKGTLEHITDSTHAFSAKAPAELFDPESSAIRIHLRFTSDLSSFTMSLEGYPNVVTFSGNGFLQLAASCKVVKNLPSSGELLVYIFEETLFLWFDGVLLFDQHLHTECMPERSRTKITQPWKSLKFQMTGNVILTNLITMAQPVVSMEYFNAWGERTQVVQIRDTDTVHVSEVIYDDLGRDAIKVKATKVSRAGNNEPMLMYYEDFVSNRCPHDSDSIFKIGTAKGIANSNNIKDEGFPYSRTLYEPDMLRVTSADGLPGKLFSATHGKFNTKYSRMSNIPFLELLFPARNGFKQKAIYEPNGNIKVTVSDNQGREVAEYTKVLGYDNILVIYEYTEEGRLAKILPPTYHEKMQTYYRTTPWSFGDDNLSDDEKYWQGKLGTHYKYNRMGQVAEKKAPDYQTKGMLYDQIGNLRFMYSINESNQTLSSDEQVVEDVIYMIHSGSNRPIEIGFLKEPVKVAELMQLQNGTAIPDKESQLHQRIVYSDTHSDPTLRGKVRLFLTHDDFFQDDPTRPGGQSSPHQELLRFNAVNHVVMKTSNAVYTGQLTNYRKHYSGGKMKEMMYPLGKFSRNRRANDTTFNLLHSHNKLGKLSGIGTRSNPTEFAKLEWSAVGQIEQEFVDPIGLLSNAPALTEFKYDSPGQLSRIQSPQLSQSMSFVDGGYGQRGFGKGVLMSNIMSAAWSTIENLDATQRAWFTIPVDEFQNDQTFYKCIQALKRIGVLDRDTNIPTRFLTTDLIVQLPLACAGSQGYRLMELVSKYLPPTSQYGHTYNYGNNLELVKAKFFGDNETSQNGPLQISSIADTIIGGKSQETAEIIWDALVQGQFIIIDNGTADDKTSAIGKEGLKSIFRYSEMREDLTQIEESLELFAKPIVQLLYKYIVSSNQNFYTAPEFEDIFVNWYGYYDVPSPPLLINIAKETAGKIYAMLVTNQYTTKNLQRLLNPEYIAALSDFQADIQSITKVLTSSFESEIGTNIFDYESFKIDANGNHRMFYAGLRKYEMEYDETSNHVTRLTINEPYDSEGQSKQVTDFKYDNGGNILNAEHRGVKLIKYHPVTSRPVLIELLDGRRILLRYDGQGERLIKRVFGTGNKLLSEKKYLRDENGRVLMDKVVTFDDNGDILKETETTYIYGPRETILGFVRNGLFYRVFTDHAGSPRLIMHGDKVVAGYDYWPYGERMRTFGNEDVHLSYLFSNQEIDHETGLYNFHARLYDPSMGRFLQPDPKEQYFSPYVYGGNSPVSMVDPDGEFFGWLIVIIVAAVVGAYFGGAAANGSWNPAKWNWKSPSTWLGIIGGGIGGALLPGAVAASIGAIGLPATLLLGVAGSYLEAARTNGNWNPFDWDWTNPSTYNAFIDGFSAGISARPDSITDLKSLKKYIKDLSKTGQKMWKQVAVGAAFAFVTGALENEKGFKFWQWDWSDPSTFSSLIDGFHTGKGYAEKGSKMYKKFGEMSKNPSSLREAMKNMRGTAKNFFKDASKKLDHPLWKVVGKVAFTFAASAFMEKTIDITKWKWNEYSTYESFLNNYKLPSEIKDMKDDFRTPDWSDLEGFDLINAKLEHAKEMTEKIDEYFEKVEEVIDLICSTTSIPFPACEESLRHVAKNVYMQLKKSGSLSEEDQAYFEMELGNILNGIRAGGKIYPTNASDLSGLIDCKDTGVMKGLNSTMPFEECSLRSANSRVSRQNRELTKLMFIRSKLNQSNNEFVPVDTASEALEYSQILNQILDKLATSDASYIESFLAGTLYHSVINTIPETKSSSRLLKSALPALYMHKENLFESCLIHVMLHVDNKLVVRTFIFTHKDTFEKSKEKLEDYLKSKNFQCHLPGNVETPEEVQVESYLRTIDDNKSFIITPDYKPLPCTGTESEYTPVPTPTGNLIQTYAESIDLSLSQTVKEEKYAQFLNDLIAVYNEPTLQSILTPQNIIGYAHGFLSGNVQTTFDVVIENYHNVGGHSLLFFPKRSNNGFVSLAATPAILSLQPGTSHLSMPLHNSNLLSTAKKSLVGYFDGALDNTEVVTHDIPSYTGFYEQIVENAVADNFVACIKYAYYDHYANKRFSTDATENAHFISSSILGELISRAGLTDTFEIFAYVPTSASEKERLRSQRMFFVYNTQRRRATVLNIIESSKSSNNKYIFDDSVQMDIPVIPNLTLINLQKIDIKINPNSISGWSLQDAVSSDASEEEMFLQSVEVNNVSPSIKKSEADFVKFELPEGATEGSRLSFSKSFVTSMFDKLKQSRLYQLVSQANDFEALVTGLLMGTSLLLAPDYDGITLAMRKVLSETRKETNTTSISLLSITKDGDVIPQTEQLLVTSLKAVTTSGQNVAGEMSSAKTDIEQHQCSNLRRLKQAFKIVKLPAVIDAVSTTSTDRILYEVNSGPVSNQTCNAPPPIFAQYYRTSYTEETYSYFKDRFSSFFRSQNTQHIPSDAEVDGCFLGAWVNDHGYSVDGITCQLGKSKVAVFKNIQANDVVTQTARGMPFTMVGDKYKKGSCRPVAWNGKPSVACDGEKTTLIYTPHFEKRMFDELDGNIMLARVFTHLGSKIWSFIKGEKAPTAHDNHIVTNEMMRSWENGLGEVSKMLGDASEDEGEWIAQQVEEIRTMLSDIQSHDMTAAPDVIEEIEERVGALKEDVTEQILLSTMNSMFGTEGRNEEYSRQTGESTSFHFATNMATGARAADWSNFANYNMQ